MAHELRLASERCMREFGGALSWLAWFFLAVYLTLVHAFDFFCTVVIYDYNLFQDDNCSPRHTASETSKKLIIVEIKNPSSKKNQQWRKACRDVKESMQRESESSRASV